MLAFISTVDSTVHVDAVVDALLEHLEPNGHELVLFDINRSARCSRCSSGIRAVDRTAARDETRPFALTVITNVIRRPCRSRRCAPRRVPAADGKIARSRMAGRRILAVARLAAVSA